MRKEPIIILREILVTQMNHWILFFAGATVLGLWRAEEPALWKWIIYSLIPLLFFAVRRYTDRVLTFILTHVAVIAAGFMIPCKSVADMVLYCILAAAYTVASVYCKVTNKEGIDGVLPVVIPVFAAGGCMLLLRHYRPGLLGEMYYLVPIIIFYGVNFLRIYLERYLHFLTVNQNSTGHIPAKEMFGTGFFQVLLLSAGMSGLMLLISDVGILGRIAEILKKVILTVLRWLFRGSGDTSDQTALGPEEASRIPQSGTQFAEEGGTSLFWEIAEKVVLSAALLAFFLLCGYLLFVFLRYIYRSFGKKKFVGEKESYISEVREKCELESGRRERAPVFEVFSMRERIRRFYKREVWAARWQLNAGKDPERLNRMTAKECGRLMARDNLSSVYEKARYSHKECTSDDIRRAKEMK